MDTQLFDSADSHKQTNVGCVVNLACIAHAVLATFFMVSATRNPAPGPSQNGFEGPYGVLALTRAWEGAPGYHPWTPWASVDFKTYNPL